MPHHITQQDANNKDYICCCHCYHHHTWYHLYAWNLQLYTQNKPCFWVYGVVADLYSQFVLHVMLFHPWNMFCTFTLALSVVCVQCPIWLFSVVPWLHTFLICYSNIFWMIPRWFQLPLLLLYHFCFYIPHALYCYWNIFAF
jgi:hypothetical protein